MNILKNAGKKIAFFLNGPLVLGAAIWLSVSSTCEWGQHYIHSLMAPLTNTGGHADFCLLCMERSQ